jgi:aminopeptidase N
MERFLDYFVPKKYKLDLSINKFDKKIGGIVVVNGEVLAETIKFHAVKLKIKQVKVNGDERKFESDGEVLIIENVPLGEVEILISYDGTLNENMEGAYLSTYDCDGEKEIIVATQFESHYAREAFPCIDEPAAKAVFELTLSVPNADDIVLANMPEAKVRLGAFRSAAARELAPSARGARPLGRELPKANGPDGRGPEANFSSGGKTVVFQPTPRMSTYLLAFVIGKFHGKTVKNVHGVEITTYCALNQDVDSVDFANEIAAKSLEFYDNNFGINYPLKKLDQVALPDFEAGAMENWGLVTYRESMLLITKNATLGAKKGVALTVAH